MASRLLPAEPRGLSSQWFWDAMDAVSDEVFANAETEIIRRCIDRYGIGLRPLVYGPTNFATFIDSANERNTIAQRGHPKTGRRDLRLIGLELCGALDSNIPLCHQTYEGNRNDTVQFPEAIKLIRRRLADLGLTERQISQLTLVYDKGNNSKHNQSLADELSLGLVGSLSPAHHPELLDVALDQFSELDQLPGTSLAAPRSCWPSLLDRRAAIEREGRDQHPSVANRHQLRHPRLRLFLEQLDRISARRRRLEHRMRRTRHLRPGVLPRAARSATENCGAQDSCRSPRRDTLRARVPSG
jgi:hypothetical protein